MKKPTAEQSFSLFLLMANLEGSLREINKLDKLKFIEVELWEASPVIEHALAEVREYMKGVCDCFKDTS